MCFGQNVTDRKFVFLEQNCSHERFEKYSLLLFVCGYLIYLEYGRSTSYHIRCVQFAGVAILGVLDENTFYLNGNINTQNVRSWSDKNPHIFREKHTAKVSSKSKFLGRYSGKSHT
ncbi:hypothetical protein NQ318_006904 [Aromia moschata]|uniref:Uncharacterized protein n=1 Tax=Aromia moschata TaxID=1265417 RepID=A0AAV8XN23_9CUCU|nr:hypothetical protein NQ318_006904 [Aromia moschata]